MFSFVIVWKEFYRSERLIKNKSAQIAVLNVKMADAENDVENDGYEAQESDGEQSELENRSSDNIDMEDWFLNDELRAMGDQDDKFSGEFYGFSGPLHAVPAPDWGGYGKDRYRDCQWFYNGPAMMREQCQVICNFTLAIYF